MILVSSTKGATTTVSILVTKFHTGFDISYMNRLRTWLLHGYSDDSGQTELMPMLV